MHSKHTKHSGFSLIEMIIVTAITAVFVAIATSSIVQLSRSSTSLINYQEMNNESRKMLETLARDLRSAVNVNVVSDTTLSVDSIISNGTRQTVTYSYSDSADLLYRQINSNPREIALQNVEAFSMNFYTFRGDATTNALSTKRVQVEAIMQRQVLSTTNTNYIISAQFVLRNHQVSN